MAGRRRARTGRGWDAAPPRARKAPVRADPTGSGELDVDAPLWTGEEERYRRAGKPTGDAAAGAGGPALGDPAGNVAAGGGGAASRDSSGGAAAGAGGAAPADPTEVAREICLRLLAVRPRTRAELATALRRRRIAEDVAAEVLDRYDEVGLIDDAAFARAWVTSRHHGRGLARRALAGELRQRGVDGQVVGAALEELDPATEATTARALAERKLRGMGRAAPEVVFRRLVGMLARKGYPAGLAVSVVKDVLAERDTELAAFAEIIDPDALTDLIGETGEPAGEV